MRALASFVVGLAVAAIGGTLWQGCGCPDPVAIVPIAGGTYDITTQDQSYTPYDPTELVGYVLTYSPSDRTVRESYTRGGIAYETVYSVTGTTP